MLSLLYNQNEHSALSWGIRGKFLSVELIPAESFQNPENFLPCRIGEIGSGHHQKVGHAEYRVLQLYTRIYVLRLENVPEGSGNDIPKMLQMCKISQYLALLPNTLYG